MKHINRILFILFAGVLSLSAQKVSGQEKITSGHLKNHVYFLASDSLEGRGLATRSGLKAAEYIEAHFKKAGLSTIGESFYHPFYARIGQTMLEGRNVVGLIEGSDPDLKDEYIIIGAHYDHVGYRFKDGEKIIYNGADDNASGTSAVIELGRYLAGKKNQLKRSVILIAFDAEESGLIGSTQFVKQEIIPLRNIKVMMSLDMIGRYAESGSLIMGALEGLQGGVDLLRPLAEDYEIEIKRTGGEVSMRTDTKPFGDVGIPAVYVTSGIVGPYHKPEDDRETLDYEGMEKITNLLADLTEKLANEDELNPVKEVDVIDLAKGLPFARFGIKSGLGGSSNVYPNDFFKGKTRFSLESGLLAQFRITKNVSLQPEVLYSMMGSQHQEGKLRLHSITAPLNVLITSIMDPMMKQRFYGNIGAYYSYHFAGSLAKEAMDFDNKFVDNEYGICYGAGVEIMSTFISINAKHGLTNMLREENTGKIRNRGVYFTIGRIF